MHTLIFAITAYFLETSICINIDVGGLPSSPSHFLCFVIVDDFPHWPASRGRQGLTKRSPTSAFASGFSDPQLLTLDRPLTRTDPAPNHPIRDGMHMTPSRGDQIHSLCVLFFWPAKMCGYTISTGGCSTLAPSKAGALLHFFHRDQEQPSRFAAPS